MGALRLATRGSPQATAQATAVADAITASTGRVVELVVIETTGDVHADVPLRTIGVPRQPRPPYVFECESLATLKVPGNE